MGNNPNRKRRGGKIMKKNGFFTFCFSFIPGAGQMYQSYMKRGVSIMILFAAFVAITAVIGSPIFAIPIPIIFAYSFFDTYNLRQKIIDENSSQDDFIWKETDIEKIFGKINKYKKNSLIGWFLIIIGAYLMLNSVIVPFTYRLELYFVYDALRMVMNYVPSIVIAILSIAIGIKFISKD